MADLHYPSGNPSVPDSRHDELMHAIHQLELEINHTSHELTELREYANHFGDWMRKDSQKSQWYYDNKSELQALVESAKWVKTLRRAVAWTIGAAAGTIVAAQQLEIWIREHL